MILYSKEKKQLCCISFFVPKKNRRAYRPPGLFQNHIVFVGGNLTNRRVAFVPGVPCHAKLVRVMAADVEVTSGGVVGKFFFAGFHGPVFEHASAFVDVLKLRALPMQGAAKQVDVLLSTFLNNNHNVYTFLS